MKTKVVTLATMLFVLGMFISTATATVAETGLSITDASQAQDMKCGCGAKKEEAAKKCPCDKACCKDGCCADKKEACAEKCPCCEKKCPCDKACCKDGCCADKKEACAEKCPCCEKKKAASGKGCGCGCQKK